MNLDLQSSIDKLNKKIEKEVAYDSFASEIKKSLNDSKARSEFDRDIKLHLDLLSKTLINIGETFDNRVVFKEVGTVQYVGSGIANISGLSHAGVDELVEFSTGTKGLILNLGSDTNDVILLGPEEGINGGDLVTSKRERIKISVGPDIIGRIINPLGEPLDGLSRIKTDDYYFLEKNAPGIIERAPVDQPLHSGIKIIDALFPIGRGQRELILGNRQTGKTSIAIDTILNQRNNNVICIYVSIGQKKSSVLSVIDTFKRESTFDYSMVVTAHPDDPPALRYLAPFAGCSIAEYFLNQGQDVLIVYDDLSKHADAYRELSLLLRRPPGREAYPGDIFFLHSRLLERACKLNEINGGGSITAIPIATMEYGNISAYIPTNLISICDGQIVLSAEKFNRGLKPAVDIGMSVSRVGGQAQSEVMRNVANELKLELSQFEEIEQFTRFGTEVDESTKQQIRRGQRLLSLLTQPNYQPISLASQIIILTAATKGYLDDIDINELQEYEKELIRWFKKQYSAFLKDVNRKKLLSSEQHEILLERIYEFNEIWNSGENVNE